MFQCHWNVRRDLHSAENLILLNDRIVIPLAMRRYLLGCIHQGHMGIEKSQGLRLLAQHVQ